MPGAKSRQFGSVRALPSGRFQARYRGPDGRLRSGPHTFARKSDAARWLTLKEAEIRRGDWIDPAVARTPFGEFSVAWVDERPNLRPKTVELYRYLLRAHILPTFDASAISAITEADVRRWRRNLVTAKVGDVTAAKAYRLFKSILATAVDDGVIRRNPCRIRGAGQETSAERPVLSAAQIFQLADAVHPRYRVLVLVAAFGSLRWGEVTALRRADVDTRSGAVQINRQLSEARGGGFAFAAPKSAAGRRTVYLPATIAAELRSHMDDFTEAARDSLVFTSTMGRPIRHSHFRQRVWRPATDALGLTGVHVHDLRHAGNILSATAGASLRELMDRMGHASSRAALVYLHGSDESQRKIASRLEAVARQGQAKATKRRQTRPACGTGVARNSR
jgi:integrase